MNKTKMTIVLSSLALGILLSGCAGTAASGSKTNTPTPAGSEADTQAARSVIAEAVIEPRRWEELRIGAAGDVDQVLVEAGDRVAAGTPLLRLDTKELELALESARQDVLAQRAALDLLIEGASETLIARADREHAEQVAQAEIALQLKELQLEQARTRDPAADVIAARARVERLRLELAQARAQDPAPDARTAELELERRKIALDETRDEYNKALDRPWEPQAVRDGWARQLKQAELDFQVAQAQFQRAQNAGQAQGIGLQALAVQVSEAEEQLARSIATQEAYALTLKALSAEVQGARLELEARQAWENPYLDQARDQEIAQAQARLRQAEIAVTRLELQIEDAEVRAPFAGTVVDLAVDAGAQVTPGEIVIVLATTDQFSARTVDLTELDVTRVLEGQHAVVTVDALPKGEFDGVVGEVALRAQDYRGDAVYTVAVELLDVEPSDALRWGMTAMVQFEAE